MTYSGPDIRSGDLHFCRQLGARNSPGAARRPRRILMRRIPALLPVPAFAAALILAVTGCSSGGNRSTQAEQAMYAAVSKPAGVTASLPANGKWVGGPADGLRVAVPKKWVTLAPAGRPGALDDVGLSGLK